MNVALLRSFLHHLDPDKRVTILRSSEDPSLQEYLAFSGNAGTCNMDPDDQIFVQIDDLGGATKAV